jgi:hypothetical protein
MLAGRQKRNPPAEWRADRERALAMLLLEVLLN